MLDDLYPGNPRFRLPTDPCRARSAHYGGAVPAQPPRGPAALSTHRLGIVAVAGQDHRIDPASAARRAIAREQALGAAVALTGPI